MPPEQQRKFLQPAWCAGRFAVPATVSPAPYSRATTGQGGFLLPAMLVVLLVLSLLSATSLGGLSLQRRGLHQWYAQQEAVQDALNTLRRCEDALHGLPSAAQQAPLPPPPFPDRCQWSAADGRPAPHFCGQGERYTLRVVGHSRAAGVSGGSLVGQGGIGAGTRITLLSGYICPEESTGEDGADTLPTVFGRQWWRRLP